MQQQDLLKFGIIPELIGRLPVVTTLDSLNREDLVRILTEPKNAMTKQYQTLMKMDGVDLTFENEALEAIADRAIERNIGARGLRSILEAVMTDVMYTVPSDTCNLECDDYRRQREGKRKARCLPREGYGGLRTDSP